jgi:hypothetical protein
MTKQFLLLYRCLAPPCATTALVGQHPGLQMHFSDPIISDTTYLLIESLHIAQKLSENTSIKVSHACGLYRSPSNPFKSCAQTWQKYNNSSKPSVPNIKLFSKARLSPSKELMQPSNIFQQSFKPT